MRALIFTGPSHGTDRSEVAVVKEPRPGPGEVTIDVAYAGLNYVDVMARRGDAAYVDQWPYHPGFEVAGVVREVGDGVRDLQAGQHVAALTIRGEIGRAHV